MVIQILPNELDLFNLLSEIDLLVSE